MKTEDTYFVMRMDTEYGVQIMSVSEIKEMIDQLPYEEVLSIFVTKKQGIYSNWTCVVDVDEFHKHIFQEAEVTEEVTVESERRVYPRFEANLKVLINYGKDYYTTNTVDVSRGGLKLDGAVPGALDKKHCIVQLGLHGDLNTKPLTFYGFVNNAQEGGSRVIFDEVAGSGDSSLVDWLSSTLVGSEAQAA